MQIDAKLEAMLDEINAGPPWTGTCPACGKKAVSYKSGGCEGSYELSCDKCYALLDED